MNTVRTLDQPLPSIQKEADKIIAKSVAKASAIAALPVPLVDIAGVTFVQVNMVNKLAELYGADASKNNQLIVGSLISAILAKLSSEAVGQLASGTSLDKVLGESLVKASIASLVTTITGEIYVRQFNQGKLFEDVTIDSYIAYFKEQLQSDRLSFSNISKGAVSAIMDNVN